MFLNRNPLYYKGRLSPGGRRCEPAKVTAVINNFMVQFQNDAWEKIRVSILPFHGNPGDWPLPKIVTGRKIFPKFYRANVRFFFFWGEWVMTFGVLVF